MNPHLIEQIARTLQRAQAADKLVLIVRPATFLRAKKHIGIVPHYQNMHDAMPLCGFHFESISGIPASYQTHPDPWVSINISERCNSCEHMVADWKEAIIRSTRQGVRHVLERQLARSTYRASWFVDAIKTLQQEGIHHVPEWEKVDASDVKLKTFYRSPFITNQAALKWDSDWEQKIMIKEQGKGKDVLPADFRFDAEQFFETTRERIWRRHKACIKGYSFQPLQRDYVLCELMAWDTVKNRWVKAYGLTRRVDPDKWNYQHGKFYAARSAVRMLREMLVKGIPTRNVFYLDAQDAKRYKHGSVPLYTGDEETKDTKLETVGTGKEENPFCHAAMRKTRLNYTTYAAHEHRGPHTKLI